MTGSPFGWANVDRHDLVVEAAGLRGGHRAPVRLERECVLVLARDAVALGDVLGGLAHRVRVAQLLHARVREAPADRRVGDLRVAAREAALGLQHHERRARHRLDAARQHELRLAEPDLARGLDDGLEPGRAEPVDGHARHLLGQPGEQARHARDVAVVLARLVRAAHEDLVDRSGIEAVALDRRRDHAGGQVIGADGREDARVAADRSAQRVDDHGVGHGS